MRRCKICLMPIKEVEPRKESYQEKENKEYRPSLFSVGFGFDPTPVRKETRCERCRKDINHFIRVYTEERRKETQKLMWEFLEKSI